VEKKSLSHYGKLRFQEFSAEICRFVQEVEPPDGDGIAVKRNEVMACPRILNTWQSVLIPSEKSPYKDFLLCPSLFPAVALTNFRRVGNKNFIRNNESTATRNKGFYKYNYRDGNFICTVGNESPAARSSPSYFRRFKR